jgi:hypothetical protein
MLIHPGTPSGCMDLSLGVKIGINSRDVEINAGPRATTQDFTLMEEIFNLILAVGAINVVLLIDTINLIVRLGGPDVTVVGL